MHLCYCIGIPPPPQYTHMACFEGHKRILIKIHGAPEFHKLTSTLRWLFLPANHCRYINL